VPAEELRRRIRATLVAAYGEGLLSQGTLTYRLDQLASAAVLEPAQLIGDLNLRAPHRAAGPIRRLRVRLMTLLTAARPATQPPAVLALDWSGATEAVLVGRDPFCEVTFTDPTVSRRHARLLFRDGYWILRDLDSTNGTTVNGARVTRCQLRPGDHLRLGDQHLVVD
jgi:hypothetical protein